MEPVISNSYTTAAKFFGESSGVLALTNSFSTDYESGGLVRAPLAEMRKGTFAVTLNTGNSENGGDPVYGAVLGRTPVLLGVGEGTGASIPYQLNIEPPTNGTLQVYANNVLVADDEYVAKGSTLTLTGVPATGYEVKSIKADNSALTLSGGRSTVVINAPMTVSAEFGEYTAFQIKVTKNSGGTVTPSDATVLVRAGAQQTFIINPDTGCRIKSVKYSGSGLTVNGNTYTTGTVNRNETLTVTFASKSDGIKDVEVITDGSVVVTVKSLENVAEQIEDNIGNTIKVDMSKSTVIDKTTLQAMTGNDVDVILDMKTYSWRINGESVSSRVNTSINLGVNPSAASIDAAYMSRFSAFEDKSQIDLTYSGSFPFVGYLTVKAPGTNPVGKYASLFYFNESTKEFEAMGYERVADDGTVTYRFTHASKYVMVVSNRILSVQDLSVGAGFREVSIPITMKRTDLLFASLLFGGVVLGGVLLFIGLRRMK